MKIILDKEERQELVHIAVDNHVDSMLLFETYTDIMTSNLFEDLMDIIRENNLGEENE